MIPELFFQVIGIRDGRAQTGQQQATTVVELQMVKEGAEGFEADPVMGGRTVSLEIPFSSEVQSMYRKVYSTNGELTEVEEE